MAQKVQVLDLGSYSVKSVHGRVPFIGFGVVSAEAVPCVSAVEPKTRKTEQFKATRDLLSGKRLTGDAVSFMMPADRIMNRVIDLPFSDRRKIDQVLGFELENHVPHDPEEMCYDYVIRSKSKTGARLFVSVVQRKEMEELYDQFSSFDVDPRVVGHQELANARLAELLPDPVQDPVAFVDVGHRKTVVSIVGPDGVLGVRTILMGGWDLTRALSEKFSQPMADAEREKHSAHLYPAGEGVAVGRLQEVADCLTETLAPLVRDMRQTFKGIALPSTVYLFGGTARLNGLDQYLARTLGVSVTVLFPSALKVSVAEDADGPEFVSAMAHAYNSQKGGEAQRINFRQREFAYEGDFKFVRGRLIYLAVMVLFLAGVLATPQVLKYRSYEEQRELLHTQLVELSSTILGEELDDWQDILDMLDQMPPSEVWTVFPDLTAHEVFWEVADIVARIEGQPTGEKAPVLPVAEEKTADGAPPPDGVALPAGMEAPPNEAGEAVPEPELTGEVQDVVHRLEFNQIRIDGASRTAVGGGAVDFTGNAGTVATMELFETRVGQHPCFHNVSRSKQENLKATPGKEGWVRFTVEFTVDCPDETAEDKKKAKAEETAGSEGKPSDGGEAPKKKDGDAPVLQPEKGKKGAEPVEIKTLDKENTPPKVKTNAPAVAPGKERPSKATLPPGKVGRDRAKPATAGEVAPAPAPKKEVKPPRDRARGMKTEVNNPAPAFPTRPGSRNLLRPGSMPRIPARAGTLKREEN